jgi:prophage regulatory protein
MTDQQEGHPADEPRRMLTITQVLEIVLLGRRSLFRMEQKGTFPASHYASPNRRFWYADEIAEWQRALPTNSRIGRKRIQGRPDDKNPPSKRADTAPRGNDPDATGINRD